jgi:hypothetical protein
MMNRGQQSETLPRWFSRPAPVDGLQASLFTEELDAVLAALRVSRDELARWHARGWTSIGPDYDNELEQEQVNEIRFVRDVSRSGLNDAIVEALFDELPRPMNFDPASVGYSFSLGWVQVVPREEPSVEQLIDEHLDEWLAHLVQEDVERLRSLRDQVDSLIVEADSANEDE